MPQTHSTGSTSEVSRGGGPRRARMSAVVGALCWLALLFVPTAEPYDFRIIRGLFLLAPLVIVPLGLALVPGRDERRDTAYNLYRLILLLQPAGAAGAVASYWFEHGLIAALLAFIWLIVTGLTGLYGLLRLLKMGRSGAGEVSLSAGLIYIAVGGGWFVFSRMGLQPMGFGDTIVLLTAVHFHYAGFAAPILAGLVARSLHERATARATRIASAGIIGGTPLVAAGITFSPVLALVGAALVAAGLLLLAVLVVWRIVPRLENRAAQILLVISSLASSFAMILACAYAYSIVAKTLILNIPQMAMFHGVANALGFSLCGLIAWTLLEMEEKRRLAEQK